jgi:hypothetical protein
MSHTYVLVPFVIAFLAFILRFYARENAASMLNPSFLLAALTTMIAMTFLALGVVGLLPAFAALGFGAIGAVLLVIAVARLFMI